MINHTKKLPWFKLWAEKLRSDSNWRKLTSAQRGIFIDLMVSDWVEGGIADNPGDAILECARDAKKRDVEVVLELFTERLPNGRRSHKRLDEQRRERLSASQKAAKGGFGKAARSASSRAQAGSKQAVSTPQADNEYTSSTAKDMLGPCLEPATRAGAGVREEDRGKREDNNTNLAPERDARSERVESADHSSWIAREIAALPPAWSPALRAKWSEWLGHLIEYAHRKNPAKDPVLCRPTTSMLDAHRRTLSPLQDDVTRIAWLETAIGAGLARPAEPTRPASAGARNKPGAFRAATVHERETF